MAIRRSVIERNGFGTVSNRSLHSNTADRALSYRQ